MGVTPGRVLAVDDERFFREAIRDALQQEGIDCEACANAREALRLAAEPRIGAVVLDLGLPGSDGLEVLRQLRRERPELKIIVLAAQAEQRDVLPALRLGASDYLAKPLHDEELLLAVQRALSAHALESELLRLRARLSLLEQRAAELAVCARDAEAELRDEALAERVVRAAGDILEAEKTSLMRLDPETGGLRVVATTGREEMSPGDMDVALLGEGVAGAVLVSGEAVAVEDLEGDPRFAERPALARYRSKSFAMAPVPGAEGPAGLLCATDRHDGTPFGDGDLTLLRLLALQLGSLLESARPALAAEPPAAAPPLPEEPGPVEEVCDADAELAREICDAITQELEPERLFAAALRPVARAIPASPVSLYLIDNASGDLVLEAQSENGVADRPRLDRGLGLSGAVLQTGWLVASERPEADPRFLAEADTPEDGVAGPLLCVPLRLRGKVLGIARAFPRDAGVASAHTGEVLAAALSAAVRTVLLYRSLLESIDEVAEARRSKSRSGSPQAR